MTDVTRLLARQTEWQRTLRHLAWSEKVRMAAKLRPAVIALRRSKRVDPPGAGAGAGDAGAAR